MKTKLKEKINIVTLGCSKNLVDSEVFGAVDGERCREPVGALAVDGDAAFKGQVSVGAVEAKGDVAAGGAVSHNPGE